VKFEEEQVAPLEGLELGVGRRLPEVDLVEAFRRAVFEVAQVIEPLIIRDTDPEFHGSQARLLPFFLAASDRQFTKVPILLPI